MTHSALKFDDLASSSELSKPSQTTLLAFCKACSDQLRLDILRVLSRDSFGVLELCRIFDAKQSGLSHHLKILANAELVITRREGNSIFYRRSHIFAGNSFAGNSFAGYDLADLQQALYQTVDQQTLPEAVLERLNQVQQERASNSEAFFSVNSDKFSKQQEQIAAYELYGPNAIDFVKACFKVESDTVLEVGPGEGAFLAELSPVFKTVYALDNSSQMLEKSRQSIDKKGLNNIHFIHGDTQSDKLSELKIDCAVMNMVLHHIPSPATIFTDLALVMKKTGQLFVTDLCHHNQGWVRGSCGDLWLGFEPEDLTNWAEQAGFKTGESIYLAQRNGFCVQIRQFLYE